MCGQMKPVRVMLGSRSGSHSTRNIAMKLLKSFGHLSGEGLVTLVRKVSVLNELPELEILYISNHCMSWGRA